MAVLKSKVLKSLANIGSRDIRKISKDAEILSKRRIT